MLLRSEYEGDLEDEWHNYGGWRSAPSMPLWAIRHKPTIASIRVVRPCEAVDVAMAKQAGVPEYANDLLGPTSEKFQDIWRNRTSVENFQDLYERDHGAGSWEQWAWVMETK